MCKVTLVTEAQSVDLQFQLQKHLEGSQGQSEDSGSVGRYDGDKVIML